MNLYLYCLIFTITGSKGSKIRYHTSRDGISTIDWQKTSTTGGADPKVGTRTCEQDGTCTTSTSSTFGFFGPKKPDKPNNCGLFLHGITNRSHFFNSQFENMQGLDNMLNERIIIEKNNYKSWKTITEHQKSNFFNNLLFNIKRKYEESKNYLQDIGDFSEVIGHLKESKSNVIDYRSICVRYFASLYHWKGRFYCCGGWDFVSHTFSISWNCIITENLRNYKSNQMFPGTNMDKYEINYHHLKDFEGNDWSHFTTNLEGAAYNQKLNEAMATNAYHLLNEVPPFNHNQHDHHPSHGQDYDIVENLHNVRVISIDNDFLVFFNESNSAWADVNRYLNMDDFNIIYENEGETSPNKEGVKDLARVLVNVHVKVNDFTNQSSYDRSNRIRKYNSQTMPDWLDEEWKDTQKIKHKKKNRYERLDCKVVCRFAFWCLR